MPRTISLAQQALALRRLVPGGRTRMRAGFLTWEASITPTVLSRTYPVRLEYRMTHHPAVRVLRGVNPRQDEVPPHMYADSRLCLYEESQWNSSMFLAETIVPWTSEWLAHYELWSVDGIWYADGEPPETTPVEPLPSARSRRNRNLPSVRARRARRSRLSRSLATAPGPSGPARSPG
jgi:hypothetical protein